MHQLLIVFSSPAAAEYRVAGIPAAARAAHAIASLKDSGDIDLCAIMAGSGWVPGADVIAECARLAPRLRPVFSPTWVYDDCVVVRGERFVAALAREPGASRCDDVLTALAAASLTSRSRPANTNERAGMRELRRASRDFLLLTGKAGDGIVSRWFNRPISRTISGLLLRIPGVEPWHASIGTAVLGIAMILALVLGGGIGLIAGAILFQAASIFDGVDGEMARATSRTSKAGATLDSVIDGLTNLAFVGGVSVNVALAGDRPAAFAGGIALATLASGLFLISSRANAIGEPINFDIVKKHFRRDGRSNRFTEWLIYLTMRDFFAAASAVMILAGLAQLLLFLFATVAAGWFLVTVTVLRQVGRVDSPRRARSAKRLVRVSQWR